MSLPRVNTIACRTLIVCAMFAPRTRSAWLLKMFRCSAATTASRSVFCWYKNPGFVPGSTSCHIPHSPTIRATRFSGSYRSMIAA